MLSTAAALGFLAVLSAAGVAVLRIGLRGLRPLELLAYGPVVGLVGGSVLVLGLAVPFGLVAATVAVTAFCAVGTLLFWPRPLGGRLGEQVRVQLARAGAELGPAAGLVLALLALRFAVLWSGALVEDASGLWAGHEYIWSDWTVHLGDTTSFAYGGNFPPTHPRLADAPLAYHYLISVTAASMVALGMDPIVALPLQSFLLTISLLLALFAFARRLTGDRAVAALATVLFILGGSMGWLLLFGGDRGPLELLATAPWNDDAQKAAGFNWLNPYLALIMSQRAALYGIPIVLLVLTVIRDASQRSGPSWGQWASAGLLVGVLPLAHLGGLAALGLIVPGLMLAFPRRGWIAFVMVAGLVGGLVLFGVQGGEARAGSAIRWDPGWLTGDDPWIWFWAKNLGLYLPLGAVGWLVGGLLPGFSRRMLLAFVIPFVVANLVIFGEYDWDNSKVLLYAFLGLSITSAVALIALWRQRDLLGRSIAVVAVAAMIGSGVLANLSQLVGNDRMLLAGPPELAVARWARDETAADAIFAVGLEHNDPIPMLAGRRVIASYPPWLRNIGLDPSRQEADLRAIMRFEPDAPALIAAYGVDYVAIGEWEIRELDADVEAFEARYPTAYESPEYRVFAVSP